MTRLILKTLMASLAATLLMPPALADDRASTNSPAAQTNDPLSKLKAYSQDKKADAVAYGKTLLKETDAKIARAEAKLSRASGDAKDEAAKEMEDLKAQRAAMAAKLDELEKKTGAAWEDAKRGFADAYKDLERAYANAMRHFR